MRAEREDLVDQIRHLQNQLFEREEYIKDLQSEVQSNNNKISELYGQIDQLHIDVNKLNKYLRLAVDEIANFQL